jgi:hypothetical protein
LIPRFRKATGVGLIHGRSSNVYMALRPELHGHRAAGDTDRPFAVSGALHRVGVVVLPLIIAILLTILCAWIVVPPANRLEIVAAVAAIELSPYLLVVNALVLIAAARSKSRWRAVATCTAASTLRCAVRSRC